MSSTPTPTEQVPQKKKSSCWSDNGPMAWFILAMIPIGIVGIIHGVEFAKEEERSETIRALAAQRYSAEEIRDIMRTGHSDRPSRPLSKYEVEYAKIQAELVRDLVSQGMNGTEIAQILRGGRLDADVVEKQVKALKSQRQAKPPVLNQKLPDQFDRAFDAEKNKNAIPAQPKEEAKPKPQGGSK